MELDKNRYNRAFEQKIYVVGFDQSTLTLEAAAHGLGIAIGRTPIVNHKLANGTLVEPFDIRLKSKGGYWLFTKKNIESRKHVEQFKEWILQCSPTD